MREIMIDGREIFGTADIHELLAEKLSFPEYYGKNLDALYDCLGDVSEKTGIVIVNSDVLSVRLGIAYEKICRVISDAAAENGNIELIMK